MPLDTYMTSNTFNPQGVAASTPPPYINQPSGNQMVQSSLEAMINPNSSYIRNARQHGVEYAAQRGGLNSSIAAGASERAAIDSAQPLVSEALGIENQRAVLAGQDWLNSQNFNRDFQGQLKMLPIQNSFNMLNAIQDYALKDPALYTPDVVSGYSNFFNKNMNDIMTRYFGNNGGPNGGPSSNILNGGQ